MLVISQAVCLLEQAISSHVYPEACEKIKFVSISQYLDDSKKLPQDLKRLSDPQKVLEEARKKWINIHVCHNILVNQWIFNRLRIKIGQVWDTESKVQEILNDYQDYWLKQHRIPVAHPIPVILQKAEKRSCQWQNGYPPHQSGIIKQFISPFNESYARQGVNSTTRS